MTIIDKLKNKIAELPEGSLFKPSHFRSFFPIKQRTLTGYMSYLSKRGFITLVEKGKLGRYATENTYKRNT
jgi:hypothetical protein